MRRKSSRASVHESDIELPLIDQQSSQNTGQQPESHFTQYFSSESSAMKYIKDMPFIKLVTFFDTFLFARGANRKHGSLQTEDLPLPFYFCNVEQKIIALDIEWSKEKVKPSPSIVLAIMRAFKKESLIIGLLGFLYINTSLFVALLTGSIIENVTASNFGDPLEQGTMLFKATIYALATLIGIFFDTWYWHLAALTAMRIRNTIIGLTYKKLQSVALSSVQEINIGKVINLLSNDINDVDKGLMYVIPLLLSPYTIGVCGFFIWEFFDYTTVFGIVGLGLLLALSNFVSNKTESVRIEKNAFTDERIKLTNELIEGIRLIKMYAWEKAFKRIIEGLREKEVLKVIQLKTLDALGQSFSFSSAQICLMIMCVMYTINGGILSPKKVYTTFMILNFVRIWGVSFFHFGAMFIANSRVMKTRVEEVLCIKDVISYEETVRRYSHTTGKAYQGSTHPTKPAQNQTSQSKSNVVFENFTAWWKKESTTPCLENINLTLHSGEITTVIGTIGSGKTSFLLSFLREIPSVRGNLYFKGKVAYVEQEPIIFPGTVRSNILFGLDHDEELYKKVVKACNLREDFKQFDSGDKTLVGERGITLSGGQKARLSLARALYSRSDIYLFDDPLSAVDSRVGRHIFNNAIKSDLLKDKVVVLVTHHLTYAKEADRVLLFEGGRIIGDGTFESLKSLDNNLLTMFKEVEEEKMELLRKQSSMRASEYEPNQEIVEEKKPETGEGDVTVSWSTYRNYAKQANDLKLLVIVILLYFGSSISAICFARVTGYWGQVQNAYYYNPNENPDLAVEKEPFDNTIFIFLTIFIVLLILVFEVIKTVSTYKFLLKANTNMHQNMLQRITRATVLFFDTTPIGTILNRFSNDIGVLDGSNAPIICDVVEGGIYISWMMITLIAISFVLLFPCLIVFLMLVKLRRFFQKPVMETKRLDLASRSPLYSEISTTINGLLAIRVYQQGGNFIRRFCDLLLNNSRAFLYMERTVRFFAYTLNLILDSLSVVGTFIFIFVAQYTNLEASLFGLALVMLQEISGMGSWVIRMSLMMDINMQSVERVLKYYNLPQESPEHVPDENNQLYYHSNDEWPQKGRIEFNNVYMKYRPEFDYVLQGLTFNITGGSKIGVVGRTGAGKSSILQVLFRMVDLDTIPGSYIKIDGAEISKIGLELLRKNLAIIPQNPVIFTGKIRRNLDPFGEFRESQLWEALEEVNLKGYVSSLSKKLDTDMTLSTSVFSAGQKQLVCLARAILRKTKILVLDEATANVDIETDDFIQKKIMERFKDCTVITIAHRLITIANYDKVLVMDKGRAVEYDCPYMLMVKKEGDKEITSDGIFADMVKKSGDSMSRKIFEIASTKYFGDKKGQKEY